MFHVKQKGVFAMYTTIKLLDKNKHRLTKQQYKTLRGQCLAGDIAGAIKGFYRLIRKENKK